ncbi:MAG: cellulase family glycosylhydrolase [Anaerolineales bacterium]|nr:cellulase family glycosylhydrolase [Anaerolineales bacterium]
MSTGSPIQRHPENPRYFLYDGKPLVLITATEHYGAVINRNFDYCRYLEDAADKRQTLSRCFLLFRELEGIPLNPHSPCKPLPGEYVAPFLRTGPGFATDGYGKFDLTQWDPEYFERLHGFLTEAARRGVIVELTLFSNTYGDLVWNLNPFNIKNNVNGVGDIAWQDYNSMRDRSLFELQMAYVRKVVQEVNQHDNFYFEVCNEPFGNHPGHASVAEIEAWQDAVRATIREEEARLAKQHMIFQVPVEEWRTDGPLDRLADAETVDGINFHDYQKLTYKGIVLPPMGRFMQRDLNLARVIYLWTVGHAIGKPMVFDEDNACTNGLDEESWTIHRKRAWGVVCSGGHYDMIDFSIQASGQETGTPASQAHIRTWMKHLSSFIHGVDFLHMTPVRDFAAQLPEHTIAATLANAGQEYVIYLADKREIEHPGHGDPCGGTMVFELPAGKYKVRRYDPASGEYVGDAQSIEGGEVSVDVPSFTHDVVVYIKAR